jgi:glutathione synthase/RimK-type ligase-like ATP-grasp enzyme
MRPSRSTRTCPASNSVVRRRVGLATYGRAPGLAPDDQLLLPALSACGVDAEPVVWSSRGTVWTAFDAVVIRSCWDYHLHGAAFHAWLDRLEESEVVVWNSPALVRWNADKKYLVDLAARGVATIPTRVVSRGRAGDVERIVDEEQWPRFVIKPAVSASGFETYALDAPVDPMARDTIARVVAVGDALVQPFADEVPRDGEYSFTFIDGAYSHATLKRATNGEFRVQTEHGGSVEVVSPPPRLIEDAARVLASLPEMPLYARVDGIARDGVFVLMELELIEPNLFLGFAPGSADRMAQAIVGKLHASS